MQQNIKKIRVRTATTRIDKEGAAGPRVEQVVSLEIIDRKAVLDSIARWRPMFDGKGDRDAEGRNLADLIREGEARAEEPGRLPHPGTSESARSSQ